MKRMILTLALAASWCVFTGTASADPGGFAPPRAHGGGASMGQMFGPGTLFGPSMEPAGAPDMYGWHPSFKRFFRLKKSGNCPPNGMVGAGAGPHNPLHNPANWGPAGYGVGGPAYNPQGYPPGAYGPNGPMMQGTLVFPHHTFVRSPRDYFMMDLNK